LFIFFAGSSLLLYFLDGQVLWRDAFLSLLGDFIQPHQESFHETRRVDGQPPHGIMKPVHRLDPGADGDAAASATGPLPLIDSPEDQALLRVDPPFAKAGVVVNTIEEDTQGAGLNIYIDRSGYRMIREIIRVARPLRIAYPGAFYHVTSRGNERRRA